MEIKFLREKNEIKEIELWFQKTDYFANKVIRGEWSQNEPKWVAYKQEALIKSKRLEELRELVKKV
jgi:hypothetical protein